MLGDQASSVDVARQTRALVIHDVACSRNFLVFGVRVALLGLVLVANNARIDCAVVGHGDRHFAVYLGEN